MERLFELLELRDTDEATLALIQAHLEVRLSLNLCSKHTRRNNYSSAKSPPTISITPLNFAMIKGKWKCARYLYTMAPNALNLFPDGANNILHEVARCNDKEFFDWFWGNKAITKTIFGWTTEQINQPNEDGATPFMLAVKTQKNIEMIQGWGYIKPDFEVQDNYGKNVLHLAIQEKCNALVPMLLKANPELSGSRNKVTGDLPLHVAALTNNAEAIHWVISDKINDTNNEIDTPLNCAAKKGSMDCLLLLLKHGADPNQKNILGDAALHCVLKNHESFGRKFSDAVFALLCDGANLRAENADGYAAWDFALKIWHPVTHSNNKEWLLSFMNSIRTFEDEQALPTAAKMLSSKAHVCFDENKAKKNRYQFARSD